MSRRPPAPHVEAALRQAAARGSAGSRAVQPALAGPAPHVQAALARCSAPAKPPVQLQPGRPAQPRLAAHVQAALARCTAVQGKLANVAGSAPAPPRGRLLQCSSVAEEPVHYTAKKLDKFSDTFEMDENEDEDAGLERQLPARTPDEVVRDAVERGTSIDVVLWRGTTGETVALMKANRSAGRAAANPSVAAPPKELAKLQAKKGGVLPEFGADQAPLGFSFGHWLIAVRINTRYLTRGSSSENGWVCDPSAPITVLATVDRTHGQEEVTETINAS